MTGRSSAESLVTDVGGMARELNEFFTSPFTKDTSSNISQLGVVIEQSTNLLTLLKERIKEKIYGMIG